MPKTPIDPVRHALNGPTMGTRWSATFQAPSIADVAAVEAALAETVDLVDRQMSTWTPASDLMRINAAPAGQWLAVPAEMKEVLAMGLEIGQMSDGAFDIGMGDVVTAWGFGPRQVDTEAIRAELGKPRTPAHHCLELDPEAPRLRKHGAIALDLSGIAKGYAVDRMLAALRRFGIENALVGLDGEMRACGVRPDANAWTIAIERPDREARAPHSIIELADCAVATSGDYRHWIEVGHRRLSHTMDPVRRCPLADSPASVTVLARTCMQADAWATALMVKGGLEGAAMARRLNMNALFLLRDRQRSSEIRTGPLFTAAPRIQDQPTEGLQE